MTREEMAEALALIELAKELERVALELRRKAGEKLRQKSSVAG